MLFLCNRRNLFCAACLLHDMQPWTALLCLSGPLLSFKSHFLTAPLLIALPKEVLDTAKPVLIIQITLTLAFIYLSYLSCLYLSAGFVLFSDWHYWRTVDRNIPLISQRLFQMKGAVKFFDQKEKKRQQKVVHCTTCCP